MLSSIPSWQPSDVVIYHSDVKYELYTFLDKHRYSIDWNLPLENLNSITLSMLDLDTDFNYRLWMLSEFKINNEVLYPELFERMKFRIYESFFPNTRMYIEYQLLLIQMGMDRPPKFENLLQEAIFAIPLLNQIGCWAGYYSIGLFPELVSDRLLEFREIYQDDHLVYKVLCGWQYWTEMAIKIPIYGKLKFGYRIKVDPEPVSKNIFLDLINIQVHDQKYDSLHYLTLYINTLAIHCIPGRYASYQHIIQYKSKIYVFLEHNNIYQNPVSKMIYEKNQELHTVLPEYDENVMIWIIDINTLQNKTITYNFRKPVNYIKLHKLDWLIR